MNPPERQLQQTFTRLQRSTNALAKAFAEESKSRKAFFDALMTFLTTPTTNNRK